MRPGPRNLITDVEGLLVGQAEDAALKSGVTVLLGERPFTAAVHVMGGAPGTRETDLLDPRRMVREIDAIVLSGGSAFGLDAASGVADALKARGRGFAIGDVTVPIVPAAIVFDLLNGGDKSWARNPYRALGEAALGAAGSDFALGRAGAGFGAMTGTLMGGTGSASYRLASGLAVGALAIVNAFGSATIPGGRAFWAGPFEEEAEFGGLGPSPLRHDARVPLPRKPRAMGGNTTLVVVATDADLDKAGCARLAEAAQDGLARALVPSHTPFDGDLVFAAATGRRSLGDDPLEAAVALGHAGALCTARAIARAVHAAMPLAGDLLPCWSDVPP